MTKVKKPDYVNSFDFYKCLKCGRLITHLQMEERTHTGVICPCKGLRYSPIDPRPLQWLNAGMLRFWLYRTMGWA